MKHYDNIINRRGIPYGILYCLFGLACHCLGWEPLGLPIDPDYPRVILEMNPEQLLVMAPGELDIVAHKPARTNQGYRLATWAETDETGFHWAGVTWAKNTGNVDVTVGEFNGSQIEPGKVAGNIKYAGKLAYTHTVLFGVGSPTNLPYHAAEHGGGFVEDGTNTANVFFRCGAPHYLSDMETDGSTRANGTFVYCYKKLLQSDTPSLCGRFTWAASTQKWVRPSSTWWEVWAIGSDTQRINESGTGYERQPGVNFLTTVKINELPVNLSYCVLIYQFYAPGGTVPSSIETNYLTKNDVSIYMGNRVVKDVGDRLIGGGKMLTLRIAWPEY